MSEYSTSSENATGFFQRLNSLVDGGWLSRLNGAEVKLLLAYLRHADQDGIAYPGNDLLCKELGVCDARSVQRQRRALAEAGLLLILDSAGGNNTTRVRICIPTSDTASISDTPGANDHPSPGAERRGSPTSPPAQSAAPPPAQTTIPPGGTPGANDHPPPAQSAAHPRRCAPPEGIQEGRNEQKGGARDDADAERVIFPTELDEPDFHAAWGRWEAYRRKNRLRRWQDDTTRTKLGELAGIGVANAIACIDQSIGNGWQGLFPEKFRRGGARRKPTAAERGEYASEIPLGVRSLDEVDDERHAGGSAVAGGAR